jgi:integrase
MIINTSPFKEIPMAVLAQCPTCRKCQSLRNKQCKCGEDLDKAKRSRRVQYWIDFRIPGGKQRREHIGPSLKKAQDADGKRRSQKRENRIFEMIPKSDITFDKLSKWYLKLEVVKALTMYGVIEILVAKFNEEFGLHTVNSLKPISLQNFQTRLAKAGLSDSYIDQIVGIGRTMVNKAIDNDLISVDCIAPFRKTKKRLKRNANARDMVFSADQYTALYDAAASHIKPVIATGYHTGMRLAEILRLKWHQVDRQRSLISIPREDTKDKEPRLVPIPAALAQIFKSIPRTLHQEHVFTRGGKPLLDIRQGFKEACRRAGIPYGRNTPGGFTFHDLRHTYNTNARRAGIPESVIMDITGHSTREMFDRYNTITREDAEQARALLDRAMCGGENNHGAGVEGAPDSGSGQHLVNTL